MPDAMSIWAGDQCFERVRSRDGKTLVLVFSSLLLSGSSETAHTAAAATLTFSAAPAFVYNPTAASPFRYNWVPPSLYLKTILEWSSHILQTEKTFFFFFFLRGPLRIQTWHLSSPAVLIFQQRRCETGTKHVAKGFSNSFCTALFVKKKNFQHLLAPTFILYIFCQGKLQILTGQNKINKVTKQQQWNYEKCITFLIIFNVALLKDAWFVQLSSLIRPHLYFCTNFILIYWIFFFFNLLRIRYHLREYLHVSS